MFKNIDEWRNHIINNWHSLKKQADALPLTTDYERLMAISLLPVLPKNKVELDSLISILASLPHAKILVDRFQKIYKNNVFTLTPKQLLQTKLTRKTLTNEEKEALDWLLATTGTLYGANKNPKELKTFVQNVLEIVESPPNISSAIRVQAKQIVAGNNIVFATGDVHIITHHHNYRSSLKAYLTRLRAEWNIPDLTTIMPGSNQLTNTVRLHHLYTPMDVWKKGSYQQKQGNELTSLRFNYLDNDYLDRRTSLLEVIATHQHIVITGGAGSGKSSLCRFLTTCLAYACDPMSSKEEDVDGLGLLGPAWIHEATLPLYVSLRNFCTDKTTFPKYLKDATAENLLAYIKKNVNGFAQELEHFLLNENVPTKGVLLILDGLDEVYEEKDRRKLQLIIENWAKRYPKCRIVVTSRTYAYRHDANWLLDKFVTVELAPYTWKQMEQYINNWYIQVALLRPANYGGHENARTNAKLKAKDLFDTIDKDRSLLPLARQPILLALLTLIHEERTQLPDKRARLYAETVELLDRWNIPLPSDQLAQKLSTLKIDKIRTALKLIAFDLQKKHLKHQKSPTVIERKDLLEKLLQAGDLGASIRDVLNYLQTRNGILMADEHHIYRFPHLSIQEYLAACALIQLYDECQMPKGLKRPANSRSWDFPRNIACLVKHDPDRWRNVTKFAGSILAADKNQDPRWDLIEELLPQRKTTKLLDNTLLSISIAGEIWDESPLKPRKQSQLTIRKNLIHYLTMAHKTEQLDLPDHQQAERILKKLKEETQKKKKRPLAKQSP